MCSLLQTIIAIFAFVSAQSPRTCANNQLGWFKLEDTFSEKHLITICDKRFRGGSIYKKVKKKYSQIDCYVDPKTKELYSCRFHHLYGSFVDYANVFRFTAYCVIAKETKKYLQSGVKIDDGNINNLKQLFDSLLLRIDTVNPPPMYSSSYMNIDHQNVWIYDNINAISRCMSHIPHIPDYIGNPWHCLSALSILYEYQHILHETREQSSYVAVRYGNDMFPDGTLLTSLIKTYFGEIVTTENVLQYEGVEDGDELYIKELRFNAKNWIKHSLFVHQVNMASDGCKQTILMDMANAAKMYWNNQIQSVMKDHWLYLIDNDKATNGFEIYTKYGCDNEYFNALEIRKNIVFVSTKYVANECVAPRCIDRIDIFVNELMHGLLFMENGNEYDLGIDVIIVGNPYLLPFDLQCLLFQNSNIWIGITDPILSVAALFMETDSIIFEILMDDGVNVESVAQMTNLKYHKMNAMIDTEMISNIDIKTFINAIL